MTDAADALEVVREIGQVRQRWKNGLGATAEIFSAAPHAKAGDAGWRWRVSIAESTREAPFSTFHGIDRELLLLSDTPLRLISDGRLMADLRHPLEGVRFSGEAPVVGIPADEGTRQLNLMWRRDTTSMKVVRIPVNGRSDYLAPRGAEVLFFVFAGSVEIAIADQRAVTLTVHDAAVLRGRRDNSCRVVLMGNATLIVAEFLSR